MTRSSSGGKNYTISGLRVPTGLVWRAEVRHGSSSYSLIESGSTSSSGFYTTGNNYYSVSLSVRVRWYDGSTPLGSWTTRSWSPPRVPNPSYTLSVSPGSGSGKNYSISGLSVPAGLVWRAQARHGSSSFSPIESGSRSSSGSFTTGTSYFTSITVSVRWYDGNTAIGSWVSRSWSAPSPSFSLSRQSIATGTRYTVSGINNPSGITWDADVSSNNGSTWAGIARTNSASSRSFTTSVTGSISVRIRFRHGSSSTGWVTRSV